MKSFRRRTWFLVSGATFAAILIALFVHSFVLSVNAVVDSSYTIRILEITDPNSTASLALDANDKYPKSELDGLQGLANVKIDTMTMKRFVSLRDNWDGKYDAVYIGKGAFNKRKLTARGPLPQMSVLQLIRPLLSKTTLPNSKLKRSPITILVKA